MISGTAAFLSLPLPPGNVKPVGAVGAKHGWGPSRSRRRKATSLQEASCGLWAFEDQFCQLCFIPSVPPFGQEPKMHYQFCGWDGLGCVLLTGA